MVFCKRVPYSLKWNATGRADQGWIGESSPLLTELSELSANASKVEINMIPVYDSARRQGMKYGIIHKDFKRAEEYVVRKAKKISEEYM